VLVRQPSLRILLGKRGQEAGAIGKVVAHERRVAWHFMSGGRPFYEYVPAASDVTKTYKTLGTPSK
jgi:hypothetical protein